MSPFTFVLRGINPSQPDIPTLLGKLRANSGTLAIIHLSSGRPFQGVMGSRVRGQIQDVSFPDIFISAMKKSLRKLINDSYTMA